MDLDFYVLTYLTSEQIRCDSFVLIKQFLSSLSCDYPNFYLWLDKIQSQLDTNTRSIVVCKSVSDGEILGVSILKKTSEENKICTLRVANKCKRMHIGSRLMEMSLRILEDDKPLITVSEDHINEFSALLKRFGFKFKNKVKSIYIKDKYEYFFNKPYEHQNVLMSIKPQYAEAIAKGEKKIEFRKKPIMKSVKWVYVYATAPIKRIIGYFDVENVVCDTPSSLWNRFSKYGCIPKNKYDEYYHSRDCAYGILIKQFHAFDEHKNPTILCDTFRAPQSFRYIDNIEFLQWLNQ